MSLFGEPLVLPLAPQGSKTAKHGSLSAPTKRDILPAGPAFVGFARRAYHKRSFVEDEQIESEHASRSATPAGQLENDEDYVESEPESAAMLNLDPKEWKKQDHYEVLGLSKLRWKASQAQIKTAHRKKVLKHHPDKKASVNSDHNTNDDSFFKCIAKAMDVLSNPAKRRQFDSVDPAIDDEDFPKKTVKPEQFFDAWGPIFEREVRFANEPETAPLLGGPDSSKQEVERFYDYWYNFDSWRSFEYEDDEINEGDGSRDEKRYRERKNRSERARKKKDDNTRLRTIVDSALAQDPRIKRFKQEEKAAREAKRKPKPQEVAKVNQQKQEEEAKAAKEAEAQKGADDKAAKEAAKKAREAAKKNLKRDKKAISALVPSLNYFKPAGEKVAAADIEGYLNELDAILDKAEPEEVAALRTETDAKKGDASQVKDAIKSLAEKKGVTTKYYA